VNPAPSSPFFAIVLAAGDSQRMGRPKALLEFDGRTALDLCVTACLEGGASEVVVVLGAEAEPIRKASRALLRSSAPVRLVVNERHATGQTSSVQCALAEIPAGAFLVFPVDLPLVDGSVVRALAEAYRKERERSQRIFVAVHAKRRGHPVLFGERTRPGVLALAPEAPLHLVVRARPGRVVEVPVRSPEILRDLDTPEDYARALEARRAGAPPAEKPAAPAPEALVAAQRPARRTETSAKGRRSRRVPKSS
jgi:CTP:molybdopterin cytidylyltransferase MocA